MFPIDNIVKFSSLGNCIFLGSSSANNSYFRITPSSLPDIKMFPSSLKTIYLIAFLWPKNDGFSLQINFFQVAFSIVAQLKLHESIDILLN